VEFACGAEEVDSDGGRCALARDGDAVLLALVEEIAGRFSAYLHACLGLDAKLGQAAWRMQDLVEPLRRGGANFELCARDFEPA
jgi:hypothetical protein